MTDIEKNDKSSPTASKVFKQVRLPFKVLDVKSPISCIITKKRRLSDDESGKDAKIPKTDLDPNTENDVNSVNTESNNSRDHAANNNNQFSEVQKPLKEIKQYILKGSPSAIVTDDAVAVSNSLNGNLTLGSSDKAVCINLVSPCKETSGGTYNSQNTDGAHVSEICISNETADDGLLNVSIISNKSMEFETDDVLDSTLGSDEAMSYTEGQDNQNGSLNNSTCSQESNKKTEASELEKSLCTSGTSSPAVSGKVGSTPVARKKCVYRTPTSASKSSVEMEKRKEEKARMRAEREQKLQEARDAKKREKEREKERKEVERNMAKQKKLQEIEDKIKEKLLKKAEEIAKKQAEAEKKLKEREELKSKKLEAVQAKLDEKKRKQEEEEDKVRKTEGKKKAEDEKMAKSKAVFANFFIKNLSTVQAAATEESSSLFKPFEVTKNMVLASIIPDDVISQFDKDNLDGCFQKQDSAHLYLDELKQGAKCPYRRRKLQIKNDDSDDIVILSDCKRMGSLHRAKLYQFCENIRPPYYGTWTKKSEHITGRRPFVLDAKTFDYEVDSEEEWDEGGPGESLSGTEEEKESEDDYEVDNEFFVPHGYLSADEEKDEDVGVDTVEHQARLKMREEEFQEERKKKFSELKPRVIGCLWVSADSMSYPPHQEELVKVFSAFKAVLMMNAPISVLPPPKGSALGGEDNSDQNKADTLHKQNRKFPDEAIPHLIRLLHANTNGRQMLQKEFRHFWTEFRQKSKETTDEKPDETANKNNSPVSGTPEKDGTDECKSAETSPGTFMYNTGFSKRQLEITMNKISSYVRCPDPSYPRCVWWVHDDIRAKYGCTDLPVPNAWTYVSCKNIKTSGMKGRRKAAKVPETDIPACVSSVDVEQDRIAPVETPNSILKFTRKMSPSERFESNFQPTQSKNEISSPKSTKQSHSNLLTIFANQLSSKEKYNSKPQIEHSTSVSNDAIQVSSNSHSSAAADAPEPKKGTGSILKFTRKITPIRLDSLASKSENIPKKDLQCKEPVFEQESSVCVIELD